jgi:acyl-CoA hydrolase
MVAMDEQRKAVTVPPLVPATPDQLRRHHAARARRELRQEFEQRVKAMRAG